MPKNKGKGGKNRKKGKGDNEGEKRELVFKEEGQEYASVTKMLGNGWIEAQCMDGEKRLGHIRGAFRKKVWIAAGDLVLLSLRDYQDSKADIILKYTADEARMLKTYGELPDSLKVNENDVGGESDDDVDVEFDIDDVSCFTVSICEVCLCLLLVFRSKRRQTAFYGTGECCPSIVIIGSITIVEFE
ncbi:Translation initiation factor 1A [Rhizoclosmatium sp. JEL0117]|nr:Translation initiation factor 1A [Rhizoclosmatium sp. JEL0117]